MKTAKMNWKAGYVIRDNGFINFQGKLKVRGDAYLATTSGIVESPMMYADSSKVSKPVIRVILVQKETISNTAQFLNQ